MSLESELRERRKKRLEEGVENSVDFNSDIAPIDVTKPVVAPVNKEAAAAAQQALNQKKAETQAETAKDAKWFQGGAFSGDGNFFEKALKTYIGTGTDVVKNITERGFEALEHGIDTGAYGLGVVGSIFGKKGQEFQDNVADWIAEDKIKGEAVADWLITNTTPAGLVGKALDVDSETDSLLGDKSDAMVQNVAHMVGTKMLEKVGVPSFVVTGLDSFGAEVEGAYQNGATHLEAGISGTVSAGAEIIFEKLSGGIKFKSLGGTWDDWITDWISRKLSNGIARTLLKFGIDVVGEGAEEYFTEVTSDIGRKLTYMDEKEWKEILAGEDKWDAFVMGAVMGAGGSVVSGVSNKVQGKDPVTELKGNEEAVVKKYYEDSVAKAEAEGKKLSLKEKNKLWKEAVSKMENGQISIETIEEVLGGGSYKNYKDAVDSENAIMKEMESLRDEYVELNKSVLTGEQTDRKAEIQKKLAELKTKYEQSNQKELKAKLSNEVYELSKGTKLENSYIETAKKGEAYKADLSKYDKQTQATIKRAMDSGVLNNTQRTHEFVETMAAIEGRTGIAINFANNAKLKEMGYYVKGATVNGVKTDSGMFLNVDSNKMLETTVGHEIMHFLEGDKDGYKNLKKLLFDMAKSKGEYDSRLKALEELYKNVDNVDIDAELAADLVGDYLFSDPDFIKNLLTEDKNLFQKIWREIKDLIKIVTPGTKEAKQLQKVEREFKKVFDEFKASGETTAEGSDAKHSLSSIANTFFGDEKMSAKEFSQKDYKQTQGYKDYVNKCVDNMRQTITGFDESTARKEVERSIDGIVRVAVAAKNAGYDILDRGDKRNAKDSKNRYLFSSLEPNSDYFTSNDISTECDKRKNFADIYDAIVKKEEALGVPQGKRFFDNVDNYFYLHKVLADKGLTQPCRECYVESMRKNLAPMANAFLKLVRESNPNNTSNDQLYHQSGKNKGTLKTNNAKTREWTLERLSEYGMSASDITIETLTTEEGLAQLKLQAPTVYEAFNSFYGQSKPKMPRKATPFRFGELTALLTDNNGNIKQNLVDKINSTGGFRLQSYSDFQIENFTDTLQVLFEAGTLGLKGHAYTKVPAFLEATDGTNLKRNISIFMYKDGGEWKLDKNDSFPYSLDEIYNIVRADKSGNTGIIAVSQNEDMSAWIMANDLVGYGIPFHKSGLKMSTVRDTDVKTDDGRTVKGYSGTKDHTKQQTEVWATSTAEHKALTKVSKGINIYGEEVGWDFENKDGLSKNDLIKKNITAYIDACERLDYLPKFRDYVINNDKILNSVLEYSKDLGFSSNDATVEDISFAYKDSNGNTKYRIPYGYYKFLGDFGMFTPDGKASPQRVLSLQDYNFDNAVDFFSDSEKLRREEILQQFANGADREYYRNTDLTAGELSDIVEKKRGEVVDSIIAPSPARFSVSKENVSNTQAKSQTPATELRYEGKDISPLRGNSVGATETVKTNKNTPVKQSPVESNTLVGEGDIAPIAGSDTTGKRSTKPLNFNEPSENETAKPVQSIRDRLEYKLNNALTELSNNERLRSEAIESYNEKISDLRREYDSKANKDTKIANNILRRIERTTRLRDDVDADFQKRISDLRQRVEKSRTELAEGYSVEEGRMMRSELHAQKVDEIKNAFSKNGLDFDDVLKKAKNLNTFKTVDNTPQRVMEKALGYKAGQILSDLTVNKVAQNESEGIKWLNSITSRQGEGGLLKQLSKQYKIKPGSKESAAAQMYAEGFYVNDYGERIKYGDAELAKDFPNAETQKNIRGLAKDPRIRQFYNETLAKINESRKRNGYPEIRPLDNYFLHFRAMDDIFSTIGIPFNPNDIKAKDLPTDLNGVTADLKPGQPYFASAMHRRGIRTSHDLIGGIERYAISAKNQIYHIDDIQTLRALRNYIADLYGQGNGLGNLDALSEEEVQDRIEKKYKAHLSTFAKFLNEEANIIAGKTALIDRGIEGIIGRRGLQLLDTINKQVGSNMVGMNLSSALTNFISPVQAFAKTNKTAFVKGFAQTVSNKVGQIFGKPDTFADNPAAIRRRGADRFYRTPWQKVADAGYVLASAVDNISTEIVVRSKYNEYIKKGMSEQQAITEADKWASRLMGDRSLGQMPQLYNSKLLGLVTKFQLEVRNQLDSQFYDTIQETKASNEDIDNALKRNAKTAAKVAATFAELAVAQHIFGAVFESIAGYNPAFDIIDVIIKVLGFDDDEESEDTALDNVGQGFLVLLEDMPYSSIFTDGGRIPISSAIPLDKLSPGKDEYGNKKPWPQAAFETLGEIAPYYVLPTGYGQIKKTVKGLSMFSDDHPIAGSYTESGRLRFPVEDTVGNRIQAGIFGQWANKNARDYIDRGLSPLTESEIEVIDELNISVDEYRNNKEEYNFAYKNPDKYAVAKSVGGYKAYKAYQSALSDIKADNGVSGSRKRKVIQYINELDISFGEKLILFKNEYPSDNTYNQQIIQYLRENDDISGKEMKQILIGLGFTVTDNGKIYWN